MCDVLRFLCFPPLLLAEPISCPVAFLALARPAVLEAGAAVELGERLCLAAAYADLGAVVVFRLYLTVIGTTAAPLVPGDAGLFVWSDRFLRQRFTNGKEAGTGGRYGAGGAIVMHVCVLTYAARTIPGTFFTSRHFYIVSVISCHKKGGCSVPP